MIQRLVGGALVLAFCTISARADIVSASSSSFQFPAIVGIRQGLVLSHPSYLRYLQNAAGEKSLTLTWALPTQQKAQRGSITIYSLRGQAIKTFAITAASGTVKWAGSHAGAGGFYIARLVYGQVHENIRMMLCY
jgi:hypothetical protein